MKGQLANRGFEMVHNFSVHETSAIIRRSDESIFATADIRLTRKSLNTGWHCRVEESRFNQFTVLSHGSACEAFSFNTVVHKSAIEVAAAIAAKRQTQKLVAADLQFLEAVSFGSVDVFARRTHFHVRADSHTFDAVQRVNILFQLIGAFGGVAAAAFGFGYAKHTRRKFDRFTVFVAWTFRLAWRTFAKEAFIASVLSLLTLHAIFSKVLAESFALLRSIFIISFGITATSLLLVSNSNNTWFRRA